MEFKEYKEYGERKKFTLGLKIRKTLPETSENFSGLQNYAISIPRTTLLKSIRIEKIDSSF